MAVDMFLKYDGIKGESQDHKHKDEIEILSFSWGVMNTGDFHSGGGGGAGAVSSSEISILKMVDSASALLLAGVCEGEGKDALITFREAGGEQLEYLKIKLSDAMISSVSQSGVHDGSDPRPTEAISINFTKVVMDHLVQENTGRAKGGAISAGFDFAAHKKV